MNPTKIVHSTYGGLHSLCGVPRAEMVAAYASDAPECQDCRIAADRHDRERYGLPDDYPLPIPVTVPVAEVRS